MDSAPVATFKIHEHLRPKVRVPFPSGERVRMGF